MRAIRNHLKENPLSYLLIAFPLAIIAELTGWAGGLPDPRNCILPATHGEHMKRSGVTRYLTIWSFLGALAVLVLLIAMWSLLLRAIMPPKTVQAEPTAVLNLIPAPTATVPATPTVVTTPTATLEPSKVTLSTPAPNATIKTGDYVQIANTGGDGLRIRSGPGTQNPALFLGMDAEVFQVTDGPKEVDGLTWFYLSAPYDEKRRGWAASNYLSVIAKQP